MLFENLTKINEIISKDWCTLDVGGGSNTFYRANYVIDILPFDERRPFFGGERKYFSKKTWIEKDICDGNWPFKNKQFDFVICSHVLEDIRDPLKVCKEMIRVGKRGYIETPSRLCESTKGVARNYITGFPHHRWLVEINNNSIIFTMKYQKIHYWKYSFRLGFNRRLKEVFHNTFLFWDDDFKYRENYPDDWNKYLIDFKKNNSLKGKTEWKRNIVSGLKKGINNLKKRKTVLPKNILNSEK